MAAAAGVPVLWEPFLLGPIFAEQGWKDSPFNVYPVKGRYMWRDVERLCAKYRIPFTKPSRFPRNGLLAARVACLAKAMSERWLPEFVQAVFRANFAEDREIGDTAEVRSIIDSLGQPGAEFVEQAQAPENKLRLREQTRRAEELGVFGAPSFVVGKELFWGNDRLEDALRGQASELAKTSKVAGDKRGRALRWRPGTSSTWPSPRGCPSGRRSSPSSVWGGASRRLRYGPRAPLAGRLRPRWVPAN